MSQSLKSIAARVKEIREDCEMPLEDVSKALGIPPDVYSDYENGNKDIPVSILYEIAGLFKIDLTELLTGNSPKLHSYCFVKSGEGIEVERYKGYKFQSLAYNFINKKTEPLLVTVEPEENKKMSLVAHSGQEFNYVLKGRIKVILGGTEIEMAEGDSIYFDPTTPHGQIALDNKTAVFLTVILHDGT